jgi:hypothetical protein
VKNVGEQIAHYYENQNPNAFVSLIKDASAAGAFERRTARMPMMIFMSEVIRSTPDKGAAWCKEFSSLPPDYKPYIAWAFRNADIQAQDECVQELLGLSDEDKKKVLGAARHDPLAGQPTTPVDLDMLWATFMATGNELAVNRIIDVLGMPLPEKGAPGRTEMLVLKGAAKWSLSSNIQQHRRVLHIANTRRAVESGVLRKELDEAIDAAATKRLDEEPAEASP